MNLPLRKIESPDLIQFLAKKGKRRGIARLEKADLNMNQNLSKQNLKESLFLFPFLFFFLSP